MAVVIAAAETVAKLPLTFEKSYYLLIHKSFSVLLVSRRTRSTWQKIQKAVKLFIVIEFVAAVVAKKQVSGSQIIVYRPVKVASCSSNRIWNKFLIHKLYIHINSKAAAVVLYWWHICKSCSWSFPQTNPMLVYFLFNVES